MILEISLFQKFILYLGSPTIALSILLGSLLVGMGAGSFFGGKIYSQDVVKRLKYISGLIVVPECSCIVIYPVILNELLAYGLVIRAIFCFCFTVAVRFFTWYSFPDRDTNAKAEQFGKIYTMDVWSEWDFYCSRFGVGSYFIMTFGFTSSFFVGLSMYLIIFIFLSSGSATSKQN